MPFALIAAAPRLARDFIEAEHAPMNKIPGFMGECAKSNCAATARSIGCKSDGLADRCERVI